MGCTSSIRRAPPPFTNSALFSAPSPSTGNPCRSASCNTALMLRCANSGLHTKHHPHVRDSQIAHGMPAGVGRACTHRRRGVHRRGGACTSMHTYHPSTRGKDRVPKERERERERKGERELLSGGGSGGVSTHSRRRQHTRTMVGGSILHTPTHSQPPPPYSLSLSLALSLRS